MKLENTFKIFRKAKYDSQNKKKMVDTWEEN